MKVMEVGLEVWSEVWGGQSGVAMAVGSAGIAKEQVILTTKPKWNFNRYWSKMGLLCCNYNIAIASLPREGYKWTIGWGWWWKTVDPSHGHGGQFENGQGHILEWMIGIFEKDIISKVIRTSFVSPELFTSSFSCIRFLKETCTHFI